MSLLLDMMSYRGKKMTKTEILESLVETYKSQLEQKIEECTELREEKQVIQQQLFNLQDGLMSIRAPEAYRDQRSDSVHVEIDGEKQAEMSRDESIRQEYIKALEGPVFRSPEDIETLLGTAFLSDGIGIAEQSLHENNES